MTVIVAVALGSVPKPPKSQLSTPPVMLCCSEHRPRVVLKPAYVKLAGGWSMSRTELAGALPMFDTRIV